MVLMRTLAIALIMVFAAACGGGADDDTGANTDANAGSATEQSGALPSVDEDVEVVSFADDADEAADDAANTPVAADTDAASGDSDAANSAQPPALATAPAIEFAGLGEGVSREIARSTDVAMAPEIENPMTFDESPVPITFSEFYDGFDLRRGLLLSEKLQSLDGQTVIMEGYVAPPLKPRLDFFVLTRIQLAFCPFCSNDVEWPTDIALVYLPETRTISSEFPVRIIGQMEIGTSTDAETGMVSVVRIYAETVETLR